MGKRGPMREPAESKRERGTYQACRDGGGMPAPPGSPRPPAWMTDEELRIWDATVAVLGAVPGLVSPLDSNAIARYCADAVEWVECRRTIAEEGAVCKGEKGGAYSHPAVNQKNAAAERMRKFESAFGMTASDRSSLRGLADSKPPAVRTRQRA